MVMAGFIDRGSALAPAPPRRRLGSVHDLPPARPPRAARVVVIGAGFGGLGAARALRQQGIDDITVLERADAVGGVWRDNTYPGAACDVPSPLYSWSWALNPSWSHRYSGQAEILAYLERAAGDAGLLDLVRTGQEVASATYDDATATWRVETTDGTAYDADVVVSAVGQLSDPVIPELPGPRLLRRAGLPLRAVAPRRRRSRARGWRWSGPARARSSSCRRSSTRSAR